MTVDRGHPRPQLVRESWIRLDGPWDFALDREGAWQRPDEVGFDRTITVPFSPETSASGIGERGFFLACWYRRAVEMPALAPGHHLVLHFGAVDHRATVWIDGAFACVHEGGYTPFQIDLSPFLAPARDVFEIVVRAEDDPHDLSKPRGKQDWMLEPHSIWYPRTTGIWQIVWLEILPSCWIESVRWTPNLERWELALDVCLAGAFHESLRLRVELAVGRRRLALDSYTLDAREMSRRISLSDPGIDDYRNEFLWSPESPTLIEAEIELWESRERRIDAVQSYTALRTVGVQGERVVLNGRPIQLRMVLDQGYWPQSGLTAPDDAALAQDVALVKAMGFNGVRKHQKIEDPRYLLWADRLGLLVWAEMPSAYRFTRPSIERLTREWIEVLRRDASHPCIVAWVPFNESWGVPNLPEIPAERHFVQALYHLTHTLDPTRLVVGNDGWESVATDVVGIHDYDEDPERLRRRYETDEVIPNLFRRERPGGRLLTLEDHPHAGQPILLTEFGGIALADGEPATAWGYSSVESASVLAERYERLLEAVRSIPLFAGFCYTQFADTYQEANGLLYADRTPKFPLEQIRAATRGFVPERELRIEREWRERMLRRRRERTSTAGEPGDGDA